MAVTELIFAAAGIVTGSGSTLLTPWVTEKLTSRKREAAAREAEEKRARDAVFDRLVILREITRVEILEVSDKIVLARKRRLNSDLWFNVNKDSTYADMAKSLTDSHRSVSDAFWNYQRRLQSLETEFRSAQEEVRKSNIAHHLRLNKSQVESLLSSLDSGLAELRELRKELKWELVEAANQLGYQLVMREDNTFGGILDP